MMVLWGLGYLFGTLSGDNPKKSPITLAKNVY